MMEFAHEAERGGSYPYETTHTNWIIMAIEGTAWCFEESIPPVYKKHKEDTELQASQFHLNLWEGDGATN